MRLMGIDYGSKRVGVSLSDEAGRMAFPHVVLKNSPTLLKDLEAIIGEKDVGAIIIGHSLDKDQKPNKIHQAVEELMTELTLATGLPIHLEDEHFTTKAALQIQGRTDKTDASAAALILNSFIIKQK